MTIELGFVFLDDPDYEKQIVFIDVPGHEKFVKTMVAGRRQPGRRRLRHRRRRGHLGPDPRALRHPAPALCPRGDHRPDQVRPRGRRAAASPLDRRSPRLRRRHLPRSRAHPARLGPHRRRPAALLARPPGRRARRASRRDDCGFFRMPVDRVFIMHGFGTVIAGTVLSGEVKTGDRLEILPERIETRVARHPGPQIQADASGLGRRTAINIQDVDKDELSPRPVRRAGPASSRPTTRLDARLRLLAERRQRAQDARPRPLPRRHGRGHRPGRSPRAARSSCPASPCWPSSSWNRPPPPFTATASSSARSRRSTRSAAARFWTSLRRATSASTRRPSPASAGSRARSRTLSKRSSQKTRAAPAQPKTWS